MQEQEKITKIVTGLRSFFRVGQIEPLDVRAAIAKEFGGTVRPDIYEEVKRKLKESLEKH